VQQTIRAYYQLTKPGIIYGNLISAVAGFLLASRGHIVLSLLVATMAGISLVIGSACVFNNYMDRNIDVHMKRTKKRALVTGSISGRNALVYGVLLGIFGFWTLILWTNTITVVLGIIAIIAYVFLYGYAKRHSVLSTLVGSISGALPPAAGYTAVAGHFDTGALLVFLTMTFWQMPHFYAIAIYRMKEYAAAGVPLLSVKKGVPITKVNIILFTIAYLLTAPLLTLFGYTSYFYLVVMVVTGLVWLGKGLKGFKAADSDKWAKGMFFFSLLVLLVWAATIAIDATFLA
jgi:protoheme IX farnesyltransferase